MDIYIIIRAYINRRGTEDRTKIYLILSMPSSDIIMMGWITSKNAKIILNDLVGFFEAWVIAVEAKTYEHES